MAFSTIHLFESGIAQAINGEINVQTEISRQNPLLDDVLVDIWANRPLYYVGNPTYKIVTIINGAFADWIPNIKDEDGFRVAYEELNSVQINALADFIFATGT